MLLWTLRGRRRQRTLQKHPFGQLFGEGVDSARGVAAIVVCRRNSSCNSSCDASARNGQRTIALFLLFRVQQFVCNRLCEGLLQRVQTCFECSRRGQVLQSHPLPISPLLQTPDFWTTVSPHDAFSAPSARSEFQLSNAKIVLTLLES